MYGAAEVAAEKKTRAHTHSNLETFMGLTASYLAIYFLITLERIRSLYR